MIAIRFINENPISDIRYASLATIGKLDYSSKLSVTALDKVAQSAVESDHSVLHEAVIQVTDDACRSDVVSHMVRHTRGHPRHYVQSKRPDWTGEERPKDPAAPRIYVSTWMRLSRCPTNASVSGLCLKLGNGWLG
jgi:hypothetical protein